MLAEPVGATLIAWALPGIAEAPSPWALAGGAVVLGGVGLTLLGSGRAGGAEPGRDG